MAVAEALAGMQAVLAQEQRPDEWGTAVVWEAVHLADGREQVAVEVLYEQFAQMDSTFVQRWNSPVVFPQPFSRHCPLPPSMVPVVRA